MECVELRSMKKIECTIIQPQDAKGDLKWHFCKSELWFISSLN